MDSVKTFLFSEFSFSGKLSRKKFILYYSIYLLCSSVSFELTFRSGANHIFIGIALFLLSECFRFSTVSRRLYDAGVSRLFAIILAISDIADFSGVYTLKLPSAQGEPGLNAVNVLFVLVLIVLVPKENS